MLCEYQNMGDDIKILCLQTHPRLRIVNKWLRMMQAHEDVTIPMAVLATVSADVSEDHPLTKEMVRDCLKRHNYSRFIEHTRLIMFKISGIRPVQYGEDVERKVREMFVAFKDVYDRLYPRCGFIAYSYVLHNILLTLDRKDLAGDIALFQSEDKCVAQNERWTTVCKEIGWTC
jgi:Poxvirus Late Transcription Factor VLTF3 like